MTDHQERMERLRRIVEKAQHDDDAADMILRQAIGILTRLGMAHDKAESIIHGSMHAQGKYLISDLAAHERELHETIFRDLPAGNLPKAMTKRAQLWYGKLSSPPIGASILDLGGGSGELASLFYGQYGWEITIADVLDWRKNKKIPFLPVVGNRVDKPDASFDTVQVITVFHHSDDPAALVREAFRLAKKSVVFVESVTEDVLMYLYGAWIDWFYNHVIHYSEDIEKKINVPCNFRSAAGWEQLVASITGLRPETSRNLGIFQHLNPEQHHLFVYDLHAYQRE